MSDGLRSALYCSECGRRVLFVFHDWIGSESRAVFEYHHHDDPQRERDGRRARPCTVTMTYAEGKERFEAECEQVTHG